jgi:hypothetical protein
VRVIKLRVDQRPLGPHKPEPPGATPGPATGRCKILRSARLRPGPLTGGLLVQRDDAALARRKSEFNFRWVHSPEGSRIRLPGLVCTSRATTWLCGFQSHAFRGV